MPSYRHYLKEWRLKRGLTQDQLAQALGTSKGMISRYETNQRGLTLEIQLRLMEALNITPAQFFSSPEELSADVLLQNASPDQRRRVMSAIRAFLEDSDAEH